MVTWRCVLLACGFYILQKQMEKGHQFHIHWGLVWLSIQTFFFTSSHFKISDHLLEKTLESPLDCKEIQPVNSKGNQFWIFIERTGAEAETPILCPPDARSQLILKDPDVGKDWRQEEKGMTEDKTVRWHHQLNGHEFEQTPGVGDGQGGLACGSPLGCKDRTRLSNWSTKHM